MAKRQPEDEPKRQRGLDRAVRELPLRASSPGRRRFPCGNRLRGEPERHVASPDEGALLLSPIPDAVFRFVLRVHSRVHAEIVLVRPSHRPEISTAPAGGAVFTHQRPATLTGNPRSLAKALAKMERLRGTWLERLLLSGRRLPEPSVFRTHPDSADRIHRLLELEAERRPDRDRLGSGWRHYDPSSLPPVIPGRGLRWRVSSPWY